MADANAGSGNNQFLSREILSRDAALLTEAVRAAEAALARDAAEVQRAGTVLFEAVRAQELQKANADVQFLPAVAPERN